MSWLGVFFGLDHEVQERQGHQQPVPFGEAAEGEAARLLAADHRVGLEHLGADVLEAHARLVDRHAVLLAEGVQHAGRGERLDDGAALAPNLEQVVRE